MPGITLTVSGQADQALTHRLATEIASLTCRALKKEPAHTSVRVCYQPREQWFIAGRSLAEHGRNAFCLEVTVTDETCTKLEKAQYHKAAFALLADLIGNVHPHSGIHVVDCRALAYGYEGVTQEYRFQHTEIQ